MVPLQAAARSSIEVVVALVADVLPFAVVVQVW